MILFDSWHSFYLIGLLVMAGMLLDARKAGVVDVRGLGRWAGDPPASPHALLFLPQLAAALIMMVVSTLITLALTPKPKPPEPGKADTPDIQEGQAPVEIFGAVWLSEPIMAGWAQLDPPEPIKSKAGKKG